MHIFVYGTLRRGQYNHHLLSHSTFVDFVQTAPQFTLVDMGDYPALVHGGHTAVVGELFDINLITLARLDLLEEVPELYRREQLTLSQGVIAMTYTLPSHFAAGAQVVESGDWCKR